MLQRLSWHKPSQPVTQSQQKWQSQNWQQNRGKKITCLKLSLQANLKGSSPITSIQLQLLQFTFHSSHHHSSTSIKCRAKFNLCIFGWGTFALLPRHRAHRYSFGSQKFLGRCPGEHGLEGPAIPSGLMLRRMSHLCTWQHLMAADDFGLTERSTSVRSHQLSSTGEAPQRQTHHFHHSSELLKRKHWGFLLSASLCPEACASSRSPGTHWAALLVSLCLPVRSSLQCLGPPCTEENAPQGLTVWGGSLNMRGKPGDWECTRCNPAISRSSHKDDVCQKGKGARPYTPGFRTPTTPMGCLVPSAHCKSFHGHFCRWSLLFPHYSSKFGMLSLWCLSFIKEGNLKPAEIWFMHCYMCQCQRNVCLCAHICTHKYISLIICKMNNTSLSTSMYHFGGIY